MAQRVLRPLDYGGLFDEMFDLYKRNFLLFMGIGGIIYVPLNLLMFSSMMRLFGSMEPGGVPDIGAMGALIGYVLLTIPLSYAAMAAVTSAISKTYLGEQPTILGSYKAILPRLFPFILTVILAAIAYGIGFVLCCVPGIILAILLAFVPVVLIVEGSAYFDAFQRSWKLSSGDFWRVLVIIILSVLIAGVVQTVLTAPFQVISMLHQPNPQAPFGTAMNPLMLLQGLASAISQTLVLPLQTIALVLLYYDIRVRKEGFDIEMLARSMGHPVEGPTPPAR